MKKIILTLMIGILLFTTISAIKNPSAVYCEEMGYKFIINHTEEGELGVCVLSDGTEVGAWRFLEGEIAQEFSYCNKKGYKLKSINDSKICASISSYNCAVCVKDGEEIEVTTLMNLSFKETTCGDGFCGIIEENYENCPQDCSSGEEDSYCDGIEDGICDSDCKNYEDKDCLNLNKKDTFPPEIDEKNLKAGFKMSNIYLWVGIILFLGMIVFGVIMFRKLKPKKSVVRK